MNYTVQQGDCMASIAQDHGFFWQTLWNLPDNADLKQLRKNQNVLLAGDTVVVPDLRPKQQPCPDGAKYTFVRKGVPEILNMTLKDSQQRPRAKLDYIIVIDGVSRRGKTNAQGELSESIPPNAKLGKLIIDAPPPTPPTPANGNTQNPPPKLRRHITQLNLGHLDPITELTGVKGRLMNLKLYKGTIDSTTDDNTTQAISKFQTLNKLPVTGIADDATQSLLQKLHGH
jgi:hypothetical protein